MGRSNNEARARAVRLAIFDVDGVLTDGTLWIGPQGEVFKPFNIQDGHGVKMLQKEGIRTAILSGRKSEAVTRRAAELAMDPVIQGADDKLAAFRDLVAQCGVKEQECAFMGDDLPDLGVLRACGFAVAPANAVAEVRSACHYVTLANGGHGAVRELCELVLRARGQLAAARAV
jgi:3-deoxy-D-manno-octulosonate 8-phosphate phosphatase (KDO 8-P phosphatase)